MQLILGLLDINTLALGGYEIYFGQQYVLLRQKVLDVIAL